jgi:hypothetical protein
MFKVDVSSLYREGVPSHMHDAIVRYFENGIPPGSFYSAVLTNDLREAVAFADHINQEHLVNHVRWLYNYAPSGSWGSRHAYMNWLSYFSKEEVEA